MAANSYADVGIKVLSLPLTILDPVDGPVTGPRTVHRTTELGICFAGSAVNSLTVKDSVIEVAKRLQFAPGYTDTSMNGVASFVFTAYRIISKEVCATALGSNGRAAILVGGRCSETGEVRVFHMTTNNANEHSMEEVLVHSDHFFIGAGGKSAEEELPQHPTDSDYLSVLKSVIDDPAQPTIGGHLQYGRFEQDRFIVYGVVELGTAAGEGVHYWRGALDLNSTEFLAGHSSFVPGLPYIDPYSSIGGI